MVVQHGRAGRGGAGVGIQGFVGGACHVVVVGVWVVPGESHACRWASGVAEGGRLLGGEAVRAGGDRAHGGSHAKPAAATHRPGTKMVEGSVSPSVFLYHSLSMILCVFCVCLCLCLLLCICLCLFCLIFSL